MASQELNHTALDQNVVVPQIETEAGTGTGTRIASSEDKTRGYGQTDEGNEKSINSTAVHTVHDAHPGTGGYLDAHHSAGLAIIEQRAIIPQTGARKIATKMEYWMYIVYCTLDSSRR